MADSREVDGLREDAFKDRLTAINKSICDVSRSVQLVRDAQVLACCLFERNRCLHVASP